MDNQKHGLTVRGDSLYCPLALSLESYWWCEPDCLHCYMRGLNYVWGKEYRPANPLALKRKLQNGLANKNPKSILAKLLAQKKTIRVGNKADPFQPVERELQVSSKSLVVLRKLRWTHVVQTRFTNILEESAGEAIRRAAKLKLITLMPVISPGLEKDWELLERKKTPPIDSRLDQIKKWVDKGIPLGVNGEPFIPGVHTPTDFENTLKRLKLVGVKSYNTYNFHFNPHVAKRLVDVPGIDIEKIWYYNQDAQWYPVLQKLLDLAKKYDILLGCPDFVNTGWDWEEPVNTCCGLHVQNPCTFNTHHFKKLKQQGFSDECILKKTWDGSGDYQTGESIIKGTCKENYSLKDIKK